MQVQELIAKKHELESDLRKMMQDRVNKFREETGYYPHTIDVKTIDVSAMGYGKQTVLGEVKVTLWVFD